MRNGKRGRYTLEFKQEAIRLVGLGDDGVWRFEGMSTWVCNRPDQVPAGSRIRSHLEPGTPSRRYWGMGLFQVSIAPAMFILKRTNAPEF